MLYYATGVGTIQRIRGIAHYALYKSTYLLTYNLDTTTSH